MPRKPAHPPLPLDYAKAANGAVTLLSALQGFLVRANVPETYVKQAQRIRHDLEALATQVDLWETLGAAARQLASKCRTADSPK